MNSIHSTAIIGSDVTLGEGNFIGPNSVIVGNVTIGNENWIGPNVIIGTPPEHREFQILASSMDQVKGYIEIGDNNIIRENSVIQMPMKDKTRLGNECYLMDGVHVGHDVTLRNKITVAPKVTFAGHVFVQDGATIGIGTAIHQFRVIGAMSMLGMNSSVTTNIKPFSTYAGSPARYLKPNYSGLSKYNIKFESNFNFSNPAILWQIEELDEVSATLLREYILLTKNES